MAGNKGGKKAGKENSNPTRSVWTLSDDRIMVRVLLEQKAEGLAADNGFKKTVWQVVLIEVLEKGDNKGAPKTAEKCLDHWTNVKSDFVEVHHLRGLSGFGWDDVAKKVEATDDVWDALLEKHPKYKKWRGKGFPLYDTIAEIVHGTIAEGNHVFHPGQSPPRDPLYLAGTPRTPLEPRVRPTVSPVVTPAPVVDPDLISTQAPPVETDDTSTGGGGKATDDGDSDVEVAPSCPSTPKKEQRGRKRAASDALPERSASVPPRRGKRRPQNNATAMDRVASAIDRLAGSASASSDTVDPAVAITSPHRRRNAVQVLQADGHLSQEDMLRALRVFKDDLSVADFFVSIDDVKLRYAYLEDYL